VVYFFGTCIVDLFYPRAGMAGIELLRRQGLEVVFPQGQTCCGQPAFNCGYPEAARTVARAQIALFPEPWPVVVPAGSCAAMMRRHYPQLFAGEPDLPAAIAFAERVHELTEFLAGLLAARGERLVDLGPPVRVTWHASCHALRELGPAGGHPGGGRPAGGHSAGGHSAGGHPLLAQLANVEVAVLARERECCGFGGTFSLRFPEISAAMVEDKAADVGASGASELLSADCGCLLNIAGHLARTGSTVRPRHLAEFLLERTGAGD
jgi:L-lactate dehydrogenase complex protein LldE